MTQLPPEAIAALERGNLIEAIKIVRDRTGMDLKSSKEAVEHYANSGALATSARADWQEGDWGRDEAVAETGGGMQSNGAAAVPAAALAPWLGARRPRPCASRARPRAWAWPPPSNWSRRTRTPPPATSGTGRRAWR